MNHNKNNPYRQVNQHLDKEYRKKYPPGHIDEILTEDKNVADKYRFPIGTVLYEVTQQQLVRVTGYKATDEDYQESYTLEAVAETNTLQTPWGAVLDVHGLHKRNYIRIVELGDDQ